MLGGALARKQRFMALIAGTQEAAGQLLSHVTAWSILLLTIPAVRAGHVEGVYLASLVLLSQVAVEPFQPLRRATQFMESSLQAAHLAF